MPPRQTNPAVEPAPTDVPASAAASGVEVEAPPGTAPVSSRTLGEVRGTGSMGRGMFASFALHAVAGVVALVVLPWLFPEREEQHPARLDLDLRQDDPTLVEEEPLPEVEELPLERVEETFEEQVPEPAPIEFSPDREYEPVETEFRFDPESLGVRVGPRRRTRPPAPVAPAPPPVAPPRPPRPAPVTGTPPRSAPAPVAAPTGPTRKARAASKLTRPSYPTVARRRGWEGTVLLAIELDESGEILDVRILESSGRNALDRAARTCARRWSFEPALEDGVAVASTLEIPVVFELR